MIETIIKIMEKYGYVYAQGLAGTLCLAGITIVAGTAVGTALALMRMGKLRALELVVQGYVWVLRGAPILLQLDFFWILLPRVLPFEIPDVACIIIALIVNSGAYVAEIIRAGVQAVDSGQMEAARSLGLTGSQAMFKVVLPQAVRNILPALGNEFVNMIKQVSLASVFFINELTTSYKTVLAATYIPIESIIIAGLIYLLVTTVLSQAVNVMEWKMRLAEG